MLVCGTLVYSRGDEVQSKREHLEYEAQAAEEGQAQPSVLMPGQYSAFNSRYHTLQNFVLTRAHGIVRPALFA